MIDVHLRGGRNVPLAAGVMRENGGGSIVNLSSIADKVGYVGDELFRRQAGIVGLSKAAAKEVAHLGVRVNVIQPGLIRDRHDQAMPQKVLDAKMDRRGRRHLVWADPTWMLPLRWTVRH